MNKFNSDLISDAKKLFPESTDINSMMQSGDIRVLDLIYSRVGFNIDEDDIIRAFRNKKENDLLEKAKQAKSIRDFYQKLFAFVHKQEEKKADKMGYGDCL